MKSGIKTFLLLLVLFVAITSCKKDDDDDNNAKKNAEIMLWMYDVMDEVYLWQYFLPSYESVKSEKDPEVFFDRLLYKEEDKWSWLTDDYTALVAEFDGVPLSKGFAPVFGKFSNSNNVFIVVSYVYPNSPAERAGLKRGDIILKINDTELTSDNYYDLYEKTNYSVTLGIYNEGGISLSSQKLNITSEIIDANPVIHHSVIDMSGHKIGYFVYVEFISGTDNALLEQMGEIMDEFKSEGITDLVIDLRYNPGGEIDAANYLASCIVPSTAVISKNVFVKFRYNSLYQPYFESDKVKYAAQLENRFTNTGHNINLNHAYFLTGNRTASASELVMIGLEPYMEVTQIGDTTYGKYTGAWVIPDTNDPPKHNWAIVPIVSKYANAEGKTDFKDGLFPDYPMYDELLTAKPFGDVNDPMLAQAIELITGQSTTKKSLRKPSYFKTLTDPSQNLKSNLFLPTPELMEK